MIVIVVIPHIKITFTPHDQFYGLCGKTPFLNIEFDQN